MDNLERNLKSLRGPCLQENKQAEEEIIRLRDQYPNQYAQKLLELANKQDLIFIAVVLLKNQREKYWAQLSKEVQEEITQFFENLDEKNRTQQYMEH